VFVALVGCIITPVIEPSPNRVIQASVPNTEKLLQVLSIAPQRKNEAKLHENSCFTAITSNLAETTSYTRTGPGSRSCAMPVLPKRTSTATVYLVPSVGSLLTLKLSIGLGPCSLVNRMRGQCCWWRNCSMCNLNLCKISFKLRLSVCITSINLPTHHRFD